MKLHRNILIIIVIDLYEKGIFVEIVYNKNLYKGELDMGDNKIQRPEYKFEQYVLKLLKKSGYETVNEEDNTDKIIKKDEKIYCIEFKFSKILEKTIQKFYHDMSDTDMIPLIFTAFEVKEEEKSRYKNKYPKLEIVDISNLLYVVKDNDNLKYELVSILPFSVEDISPQKAFIDMDFLQHDNYIESLIEKLKLCKSGKKYFFDYEDICYSILELLFANELDLWKKQEKSNNDLYRFDLICRIKDDNKKTFWTIVENYFKSKYVIFEFKNYSKKVTQKEIYTTEKYLYSKALRSVGIIITPNGYDTNAFWAAKGCLRENGKLILLLTNNDLLQMIEMKKDEDNQSDYLLNKLDEILLNLEK